jgi:1,4-alpha-glucan branching enzyme
MNAARWARLLLALMTLAGGRAALAQATGNSTEFLADNRVTFRLYAPEATDVRLSGNWPDGAKVAMTKDDKGISSATVCPLKP